MRKSPHPVDVHVGGRVKLRRKLLGMNQERLGDAVNLTYQQIQKYERGATRMGGSRLYQFALLLDVPVSFFFDDMPADLHDLAPVVEPSQVWQTICGGSRGGDLDHPIRSGARTPVMFVGIHRYLLPFELKLARSPATAHG